MTTHKGEREEALKRIAKERADWLLDAVACATQDRRFLRGGEEYDAVAGEAILLNAAKAIQVAVSRALLSSSKAEGEMREALEKAGARFRFYEREHQAKADAVYAVSGPLRDEYEKRLAKAKTNKDFADMCAAVLTPKEGA